VLILTTFAVEPKIISYFDNGDFVSRQQRHCSHPIHLLQRTMSSTPTTTPTTSPYKAGVGRTTRSLSISTLPSPTTSGRPLRSLSSTISSPSRFIPQGSTQYNQAIAKSMTIDEMRLLHQKALGDAEAKRTELRLVLASRYRELVGSSDEVTKMRERSTELHQLVHALPSLMAKLAQKARLTTKNQQGSILLLCFGGNCHACLV
jgi:Vps51/Vps67